MVQRPANQTARHSTRPALGGGVRVVSPFAQVVRNKVGSDPLWSFKSVAEHWICPFCLSAVAKRSGRAHEDLIANHLEICRSFAGGRGAPAPLDAIAERKHVEDLQVLVPSNQAWQMVEADGAWVCPSCLVRQSQVRLVPGRLDVFSYQAMARHLVACQAYAHGQIRTLDEIQRSRDQGGRINELARTLVGQLVHPSWRCADASGTWVCPCCLTAAPGVMLGGKIDWNQATVGMARHLLAGCSRANAGSIEPHPEAVVAKAAGRPPLPMGGTIARAAPIARPVVERTPLGQPIAPVQRTPVSITALPEIPEAAPLESESETSNWLDAAENIEQESSADHLVRTDVVHARKLQEKLLQRIPTIPGLRFATRFEACHDITGDFCVFVELPAGDIGFALGDVSGHGVQAGLVMSMAKKTLEIYAAQGNGPADTLAMVNDSLAADLGGKLFISMVYAVYSHQERTITWARAGHNPALRYHPEDGTVHEIRPRGMVVGMKSGPLFRNCMEEEITPLRPGEMFLLYTDGITETMNAQQEEFGTDRLMEIVTQHAAEGPERLIGQISERVRHFRGPRPVADDASMVALLIEDESL